MHESAIRFETFEPLQAPNPARMDVTCFIGLVSERSGVALPDALITSLRHVYGLSAAELDLPGRLSNKPVPVTSTSEFESLFDPDTRLERQAIVESNTLNPALSLAGDNLRLSVIINGIIHQSTLSPTLSTPEQLAAHLTVSLPDLDISLIGEPERQRLSLALPISSGTGTLAILPNAAIGFPVTRRSNARSLPSIMAQAVRQFFAAGGRKAYILSMGDPIPYDSTEIQRRSTLLQILSDGRSSASNNAGATIANLQNNLPDPTVAVEKLYGIAHLYALPEVTFICVPDLTELVAPRPLPDQTPPADSVPLEIFDECLVPMATSAPVNAAPYKAPVLDLVGLGLWKATLERILRLLRRYERDKLLVAALPRFSEPAVADDIPRSAFLQLASGWVRTDFSRPSPEGLMAPDALLAGHFARCALAFGSWRNAASLPLESILGVEPHNTIANVPTCDFYQDLHGPALTADVTTSNDALWINGPASRVMALLLRQSRQLGNTMTFEPSGESLWARVRVVLRNVLNVLYQNGGLSGTGEGDSYTVICDRTTMTQQDIDAGRLIAEVSFRPATSVEKIKIRLPVTGNPGLIVGPGGPA